MLLVVEEKRSVAQTVDMSQKKEAIKNGRKQTKRRWLPLAKHGGKLIKRQQKRNVQFAGLPFPRVAHKKLAVKSVAEKTTDFFHGNGAQEIESKEDWKASGTEKRIKRKSVRSIKNTAKIILIS